MQSVMAFYVLLYFVLGLVIYHSMFDIWYFNLGKALLRELVGAILFAVIMAGFTLKFWWIALIIVILIGLGLSAKVSNPTGKKIIIGVFAAVAVLTAITGIKFNKQLKNKENQEQEKSQDYVQEQTENQTQSQTQSQVEQVTTENTERQTENNINNISVDNEEDADINVFNENNNADSIREDANSEGNSAEILFSVEVTASDGGVNLRSGPGTDYDIVEEMIPNGTQMDITETTNSTSGSEWYYTEHGGKEGWIYAKAVTKITNNNDSDSAFDDVKNKSIPQKSPISFTSWSDEYEALLTLDYNKKYFNYSYALFSDGEEVKNLTDEGGFSDNGDGTGKIKIFGEWSNYVTYFEDDHYVIRIDFSSGTEYFVESEWAYSHVG